MMMTSLVGMLVVLHAELSVEPVIYLFEVNTSPVFIYLKYVQVLAIFLT